MIADFSYLYKPSLVVVFLLITWGDASLLLSVVDIWSCSDDPTLSILFSNNWVWNLDDDIYKNLDRCSDIRTSHLYIISILEYLIEAGFNVRKHAAWIYVHDDNPKGYYPMYYSTLCQYMHAKCSNMMLEISSCNTNPFFKLLFLIFFQAVLIYNFKFKKLKRGDKKPDLAVRQDLAQVRYNVLLSELLFDL